jgi:hypothetical protein
MFELCQLGISPYLRSKQLWQVGLKARVSPGRGACVSYPSGLLGLVQHLWHNAELVLECSPPIVTIVGEKPKPQITKYITAFL